MLKTKTLLSAVFFMACLVSAQSESRIGIAVNDLSGKGIDKSTAEICSDRLRNELVQTGAFRVMERGEMETILKEQGFQQSGACDDQACLVEVGQLLGVERMVSGSIGKVGDFYTISLRTVDVSTGEILSVVNEDFTGQVDELISKAVGNAARKLGGGTVGDGAKPVNIKEERAVEKNTGTLSIRSKPAGADVYLNGTKAGLSPWENEMLVPGNYALKISLKGFVAVEDSVTVNPYSTTEKSYRLKAVKSVEETAKKPERKRGQVVRRITLGVLSAGFAGCGYVFEMKSNTAYNTYSEVNTYDQVAHDENWGTVDKSEKFRNAFYILSGLAAVGFVVSIPF